MRGYCEAPVAAAFAARLPETFTALCGARHRSARGGTGEAEMASRFTFLWHFKFMVGRNAQRLNSMLFHMDKWLLKQEKYSNISGTCL